MLSGGGFGGGNSGDVGVVMEVVVGQSLWC